ncbi:MAG: ribonuclease P protein component [Gammaproteobacteria bacterium]|nr:ribonuclease P protein component [Gammaproteobacteria bacterium]MCW8924583.1 ribonuclease P protein component [Gammaproteobacteria bacterium]
MQRACLSKHDKLLNAAEFNRVFDKSVRSSDQYFTILASPNDLEHPRLGMAISKRRVKLAVVRNRIKRIIRESFRLSQQNDSADYVVMAGKLGARGTNQQLRESLEKHWGLLKKKCAKS